MMFTMSGTIGHFTRHLINMIQQDKTIGGKSTGKEVELPLFIFIRYYTCKLPENQ